MMKNRKQLTALGLSALMAVSLTACSSGSGSAPASSQPCLLLQLPYLVGLLAGTLVSCQFSPTLSPH